MNKEDLNELLGTIGQAEEFKPVAASIITALELYGPEIRTLLNHLIDGVVDGKARAFNRLVQDHNFSREEAMALTLDIQSNISRGIRQNNQSRK